MTFFSPVRIGMLKKRRRKDFDREAGGVGAAASCLRSLLGPPPPCLLSLQPTTHSQSIQQQTTIYKQNMLASLAPRLARPTTVVNSSSAATRAILAGRRSISTSAITRASPEASGTGGSANKEKGPLGVPISGSKSGDSEFSSCFPFLAGDDGLEVWERH